MFGGPGMFGGWGMFARSLFINMPSLISLSFQYFWLWFSYTLNFHIQRTQNLKYKFSHLLKTKYNIWSFSPLIAKDTWPHLYDR
jgi:hypothetical protein